MPQFQNDQRVIQLPDLEFVTHRKRDLEAQRAGSDSSFDIEVLERSRSSLKSDSQEPSLDFSDYALLMAKDSVQAIQMSSNSTSADDRAMSQAAALWAVAASKAPISHRPSSLPSPALAVSRRDSVRSFGPSTHHAEADFKLLEMSRKLRSALDTDEDVGEPTPLLPTRRGSLRRGSTQWGRRVSSSFHIKPTKAFKSDVDVLLSRKRLHAEVSDWTRGALAEAPLSPPRAVFEALPRANSETGVLSRRTRSLSSPGVSKQIQTEEMVDRGCSRGSATSLVSRMGPDEVVTEDEARALRRRRPIATEELQAEISHLNSVNQWVSGSVYHDSNASGSLPLGSVVGEVSRDVAAARRGDPVEHSTSIKRDVAAQDFPQLKSLGESHWSLAACPALRRLESLLGVELDGETVRHDLDDHDDDDGTFLTQLPVEMMTGRSPVVSVDNSRGTKRVMACPKPGPVRDRRDRVTRDKDLGLLHVVLPTNAWHLLSEQEARVLDMQDAFLDHKAELDEKLKTLLERRRGDREVAFHNPELWASAQRLAMEDAEWIDSGASVSHGTSNLWSRARKRLQAQPELLFSRRDLWIGLCERVTELGGVVTSEAAAVLEAARLSLLQGTPADSSLVYQVLEDTGASLFPHPFHWKLVAWLIRRTGTPTRPLRVWLRESGWMAPAGFMQFLHKIDGLGKGWNGNVQKVMKANQLLMMKQ